MLNKIPILSCLVLPCLALSCFVLSCLVLSCLVLSCLVLSCLVLSCLVLSLATAVFGSEMSLEWTIRHGDSILVLFRWSFLGPPIVLGSLSRLYH